MENSGNMELRKRDEKVVLVPSDDESNSKKQKDPGFAPRRNAASSGSTSARNTRRREQHQEEQRKICLGVASRVPRGVASQTPRTENSDPRVTTSTGSTSDGLNLLTDLKMEDEPPKKTIFSWLIDQKVIANFERVDYMSRDKSLMDGRVKRDGILCSCCNRVVTVDVFEAHAGNNSGNRPYKHIFAKGKSLFQCQIEAWHKQEEAELRHCNVIMPVADAVDANADVCLICGDGGELICCEMCPSTFDLRCLGLKDVPPEDWLCSYCVCKFCMNGGGAMNTCLQCEKKYHLACSLDLNSRKMTLFCTQNCMEVYMKLQALVGVKHELGTGMSWTLIRRMIPDDLKFYNEYLRAECNTKVALAWQVLNECFDENIDRHTQINVVQSVAYNKWSNFMRINFRGFYTAILEVNGGIVAAACIRVHGTEFAEMPFIGTRLKLRKRGLSTVLLSELERILSSLRVAKLVIPSIEEVKKMWEEKHGFSCIDDLSRRELKHFNPLMFPAIERLQKNLCQRASSSAAAVTEAPEAAAMADEASGSASAAMVCEPHASSSTAENNGQPTRKRQAPFDLNLEPPLDLNEPQEQ